MPPNWRVVERSACTKASKIRACWSGAMPMPVSSTVKTKWAEPATATDAPTRRSTCPRDVNLTAFPTRFTRIWRSRTMSPSTNGGSPRSTAAESRTPSRTCGRRVPITSSSNWPSSKGVSSRTRRPASIFEKSSTSSVTASNRSADRRAVLSCSNCCGVMSVLRARLSIPITPFSGVRISWLIIATNSDRAWASASASSFAFCRAASVRRRSLMSRTKALNIATPLAAARCSARPPDRLCACRG